MAQGRAGRPRRPLERVVRRLPRIQSQRITVSPERPLRRWRPSYQTLLIGFPLIIAIGTVLLAFPFATQSHERAPILTALFTSTSATCVVGLTMADTSTYWSFYGQVVILALILVGGLGYMTGFAALLIAAGQHVSLSQRQILRFSLGGGVLGRVDIEAVEIVILALLIQALGATALFVRFLFLDYAPGTALWQGVFHAISAFNNAGFDITGGAPSFVEYQSDPFIILPTAILAMMGASGIIVVGGLIAARRWGRLTLDAKLVLTGHGALWIVGTLGILISEWTNPGTMGGAPMWERFMNSFALSVFTRTAGLSSYDPGAAREYTLFFMMILMFIGGASGSTAGGIKVNTFGVLLATVWAAIRGRPQTEVYGREIAERQVRDAVSVIFLAFLWVNAVALVLSLLEPLAFLKVFFETVSAFGLVGLSTGITPSLTQAGQALIVVTMLLGRLGPLTVALALARRQSVSQFRYAREEVRIG